jgi:hypothetical protein
MAENAGATAQHGRPILVGEFGWGGEPAPLHDHTHVGLWSAVFSGAGVLAHAAPRFNADSDAPLSPARAAHFRTLARFLELLGERPVGLPSLALASTERQPSVWVTSTEHRRAIWVLAPRAGYGTPVERLAVALTDLPPGRHAVAWYDDVTGSLVGRDVLATAGGTARLRVPAFTRHIAGVVTLDGGAMHAWMPDAT